MNPQLRQHGRSYFLLLGLLVGALFVGFNSAQATQLRTTSPGVLAAASLGSGKDICGGGVATGNQHAHRTRSKL